MAITTRATLLVRRGFEADFNPSKMKQGEWALSTDNRYIRMCVANGVCLRMATYEAFERDMQIIEQMLRDCEDIKDAIIILQQQINDKADEFILYVDEAKADINTLIQNFDIYIDETKDDINNSINEYKAYIVDSEERIEQQVKNALDYADDSLEFATLSRSWAIGDTESRDGETIDNSKYYAELSKSEKEASAAYADEARELVETTKKEVSGYVFWIEEDDGCLYVDTESTVQTFYIDADGYLCVEV